MNIQYEDDEYMLQLLAVNLFLLRSNGLQYMSGLKELRADLIV